MAIVASEDSPTKRTQDIRDSPPVGRGSTIDGHCWYPAAQRCGCGLNLRSALLWTDHIANLAAIEAVSAV